MMDDDHYKKVNPLKRKVTIKNVKKYGLDEFEIEELQLVMLFSSLPYLLLGIVLLTMFLVVEKDGFAALQEKDGFP